MRGTPRRAKRSLYVIGYLVLGSVALLLLAHTLMEPLEMPRATRAGKARPVETAETPREEPPTPKAAPTMDPSPPVLGEVTSIGFPARRVRAPHLAENWAESPEAYLTENRIVLRSLSVASTGKGMRIEGRLWSDFEVEATRVMPAGQLMGLEIEVSLHEIESDIADKLGMMVPTQFTVATIDKTETAHGITLGSGEFKLPEMKKPLPPGVYRLVCRLTFNNLTDLQKEALKWVPDLYGAVAEYNADGRPLGEGTPVYRSKFHISQWREMVANEVCTSEGTLFLGNVLLEDGSTKLDQTNCLCRDPSYSVFKTLDNLNKQRELLLAEYEMNRKNSGLDQKRAKATFEQSLKHLDMHVARAGGPIRAEEIKAYTTVSRATRSIREALIVFEDDLTLKYWIALDTFYYDFHTVNKLGYNCAKAIADGDNEADRRERERKAEGLRDTAKRFARDERRESNFKYIPEPIKKAAFNYAKRSEETSDFDSDQYTTTIGKEVRLEPEKWGNWRTSFLAEFRPRAQAALAELDLSKAYFIQKWPQAYQCVQDVRDAVIAHAFCYEYYLRMIPVRKQMDAEQDPKLKAQIGADADKAIDDDWATEAGEAIKELKPIYSSAKVAPASVFSRFETAYKQAKSEKVLDMADYAWRYKLSVDKQPYPPPRRYKAEK